MKIKYYHLDNLQINQNRFDGGVAFAALEDGTIIKQQGYGHYPLLYRLTTVPDGAVEDDGYLLFSCSGGFECRSCPDPYNCSMEFADKQREKFEKKYSHEQRP